ncbi:MAG: retropepsin-like aspartic protease [Bacteroidota bacterium]
MRFYLLHLVFLCSMALTAQDALMASKAIFEREMLEGEIVLDFPPRAPKERSQAKENARWPFQLQGGLILVEACVDDHKTPFLLDSGAPNLFINGVVDQESANFSALGVNGSLDIAEHSVQSFQLGNIHQREVQAYQLDISHLEEAKDCKMGGIIGYDQIKNHEILIDYQNEELTIVEPGNMLSRPELQVQECIPFSVEGHFAVIKVSIADKQYNFGIDTGAETNVLHKKLYRKLKKRAIESTNKISIRGIDRNTSNVLKCELKALQIADKTYENLEFVFADLKHLNKAYGIQLHGLLGYPFLKTHLYSLNYRDGELCFWESSSPFEFETEITYHKDDQ